MLRSPATSRTASGKKCSSVPPEHHMVEAHDSRDRPAGALASYRRSQVRGVMHAFSCVLKETAMPDGAVEVPHCHERPNPFCVRNPDRSSVSGLSWIHRTRLLQTAQEDYRASSAQPTVNLNGFRGWGDHRSLHRKMIEAAMAKKSMKSRVCWVRRPPDLPPSRSPATIPHPSGRQAETLGSIAGDADRPGESGWQRFEGRRM